MSKGSKCHRKKNDRENHTDKNTDREAEESALQNKRFFLAYDR